MQPSLCASCRHASSSASGWHQQCGCGHVSNRVVRQLAQSAGGGSVSAGLHALSRRWRWPATLVLLHCPWLTSGTRRSAGRRRAAPLALSALPLPAVQTRFCLRAAFGRMPRSPLCCLRFGACYRRRWLGCVTGALPAAMGSFSTCSSALWAWARFEQQRPCRPAPQATTARHAAELLGALLSEHGAGEGFGVLMADARWVPCSFEGRCEGGFVSWGRRQAAAAAGWVREPPSGGSCNLGSWMAPSRKFSILGPWDLRSGLLGLIALPAVPLFSCCVPLPQGGLVP